MHGTWPSTKPVCAETNVTDIGRKPAGTGPPPTADGEAAVGLAAGAGALDVGADVAVAGADDVGEAEVAGDAAAPELTAGEVLTCAPPWWVFEQPASASDMTTARVASRRVDDDARGVMLLGRCSNRKGCVLHRTDRRGWSPGVGQVSLRASRVRVRLGARLAQAIGDNGANLTQQLNLLRGQRVEQVRTHALDMAWCRGLEGGETRIGQDGELPTTVGGARLSSHPAVFFQSCDRMRQPATRRHRSVREVAHAQASFGHLRKSNQNLVVGVRHGRVAGEFLIEALEEHVRGFDEGAPDALFGSCQPSSRRRRVISGGHSSDRTEDWGR